MDPGIAAALIGLPVALTAAVAAELLRRRGHRAENKAHLEITRVDFQRGEDAFFPSLDVTVRNLSATSCVITEAEISKNVTTWEFPPRPERSSCSGRGLGTSHSRSTRGSTSTPLQSKVSKSCWSYLMNRHR